MLKPYLKSIWHMCYKQYLIKVGSNLKPKILSEVTQVNWIIQHESYTKNQYRKNTINPS